MSYRVAESGVSANEILHGMRAARMNERMHVLCVQKACQPTECLMTFPGRPFQANSHSTKRAFFLAGGGVTEMDFYESIYKKKSAAKGFFFLTAANPLLPSPPHSFFPIFFPLPY